MADATSRVRFWNTDGTAEWATLGAAGADTLMDNTAFVDASNGDDSTGTVGNMNKPFQTGAGAEGAVSSGDTIYFHPGVHTVTSLGVNGVSYHVPTGAELSCASGNMFDVAAFETVKVYGGGKLNQTAGGSVVRTSGNAYIDVAEIASNANDNVLEVVSGSNGQLFCRYNYLEATNPGENVIANDSAFGYAYVEGNYTYLVGKLVNSAGYVDYKGNSVHVFFDNNANNVVFNSNGGNVNVEVNKVNVYNFGDGTLVRAGASGKVLIQNTRIYYAKQTPTYAPINAFGSGTIIMKGCYFEYYDILGGTSDKPIVGYYSTGNNTNAFFEFYDCQLLHRGQLATCEGFLLNSGTSPADGNLILSNTQIILDSTAVGLGAKAIDAGAATLSYRLFTDVISNGAFDGTNLVTGTSALVDAYVKSA